MNRLPQEQIASDAVATRYFLCGKMAAGKSTLSKALARMRNAVLLSAFVGSLNGQ